jgi:cold shock CspA family protein
MNGHNRLRGTVKMKKADKGYGFIVRSDGAGDDAFFHVNGLSPSTSFEALQPGDAVEFDLIIDARSGKFRAVDVAVL